MDPGTFGRRYCTRAQETLGRSDVHQGLVSSSEFSASLGLFGPTFCLLVSAATFCQGFSQGSSRSSTPVDAKALDGVPPLGQTVFLAASEADCGTVLHRRGGELRELECGRVVPHTTGISPLGKQRTADHSRGRARRGSHARMTEVPDCRPRCPLLRNAQEQRDS